MCKVKRDENCGQKIWENPAKGSQLRAHFAVPIQGYVKWCESFARTNTFSVETLVLCLNLPAGILYNNSALSIMVLDEYLVDTLAAFRLYQPHQPPSFDLSAS